MTMSVILFWEYIAVMGPCCSSPPKLPPQPDEHQSKQALGGRVWVTQESTAGITGDKRYHQGLDLTLWVWARVCVHVRFWCNWSIL